jgi:hypothetical protein
VDNGTGMQGHDGDKERFGPVLRVAALVATLLALGAVIGPRLAFSGGGGSRDSSTAAASLPAGAIGASHITGTSVPERAETTSPAAAPTTTSSTSATSTTTLPAASPSTTAPIVAATPVDPDTGAVDLALVGVHAGRHGAERSGFFAGDTIGWHFRVINTGGEYLWGVFVYLELSGPVSCSARRLAVGESADCWAETTAMAGSNDAEAWVTAWTASRMVTDRVSHRVGVVAG